MRPSPRIIYLLFFFSGAAGLIYEIVWGRLLVLIFGSTTNSIVAVISAFLGGLAIGSLLFGQVADRLSAKSLIRTYALLEIGIGASAAATLIFLNLIRDFYSLFSDGSSVTLTLLLVKFTLTIFVLLVPTILMGATLPILIRFAQIQTKSLGKSVSLLYAVNTLGGVAGVLISAFVLIEIFGLQKSLFIATAINLTIGAVASRIAAKNTGQNIKYEANLQLVKIITPARAMVLVAFFLSGLIAIAYEVLWSRLFTPTIGTLIYAFATVLAIYILGIGLGSLAYPRFAKIIEGKNLAFAICEAGIGIFAIISIILTHKFEIDTGFRVAALVLPATFLMGLTFPVVVALLSDNKQSLRSSQAAGLKQSLRSSSLRTAGLKHTGRIVGASYFANTVGSITGGFLASFLFIPIFGSAPSILILAIANLTIAVVFTLRENLVANFFKYSVLSVTLIVILGAFYLLRYKVDRLTDYTTDLRILTAKFNKLPYAFREDEIASVFAYLDPKTNEQGLFIDGVATTSRVSETRFMAHIPIALHQNPQKVLVIAFGMGTTFRSSLAQNLETDAIELVPSVPSLMHFFHPDAESTLTSPKGRVIINDGRNYAVLTDKKYDIVTIDPPPPFNAAGTTVLHSKEFYQDLIKILEPGGIVSQWIYYNGSREDDIAMVIKSFLDVFPHVLAFQKTGSVGGIFLQGSLEPLDPQRVNLLFQDPQAVRDLEEVIDVKPGTSLQDNVTIELVGTRESLAKKFAGSKIVSDNHPRTEYFKLRHEFVSSPILVEENSIKFIEELKGNLKR